MIKKIVMTCGLIILIPLALVFTNENIRDNPKTILNSISTRAGTETDRPLPKEGEKLTYLIKYLWIIPVGGAEIEIGEKENYKNHRVYPLIAKGKTPDFISPFLKAGGTVKSYVDVNKLYTLRYEEKAQAEGHSPSNKVILYNQDTQIMEFEDIKRRIPENTQDPLSALFYLRWQEYEKHKDITLNVNSNQENYTLLTKLSGRDSINIDGRKAEILITTSTIKSPKRYSKPEAEVTTFIVDDVTRIPFLIKVRTKFGPLTIRLIDIK